MIRPERAAAGRADPSPRAPEPDEPTQRLTEGVGGELGRGGMGVVYRARDPRLGREVALKVLLGAEGASEELIERFQREARAAAALEHPGIVRVYDVGSAEGKPYYAMELVPGRGLDDALHARQVSVREAVDVTRQIALALAYAHAHAHGVLHRDIKPRNVVVRREGEALAAKLLDFGLAKFTEAELRPGRLPGGQSLTTLTATGQLLGTPAYMSPEQIAGAGDVDARTDVYSLGATLYEALTGRLPFERTTLAELLQAVRTADPVPPRRLSQALDADLETICLRCLHKEPRDRYASAAELAEDCRRWLAGEPIVARPLGTIARLWRKSKRHRAVAALSATIAVLVVGGIVTAGAREWGRRRAFASALAEGDAALAAGDLPRALASANRAGETGPGEPRAKALLSRVQAESAVRAGDAAFDRYLSAKATAEKAEADLEQARKAHEGETSHLAKQPLWEIEALARTKAEEREREYSSAASSYIQALGAWGEHPRAKDRLADLTWDRFLRAEREGDDAERNACEALVLDLAPARFEELLRGEKEVRVAFLLPATFAGKQVRSYLYRYEPLRIPPVVAPVPYDAGAKKTVGAAELGPAEPVPLPPELPRGPVRILEAAAASQAARIGLRAGDEIVSVADAKYEEVDDVYAAILAMAPQQEYEVVVRRGNEEVRVKAKGPDFGARMGQAAPAPAGSDLARAAREARIGSVWRLPCLDANAIPLEATSGLPRRAELRLRLPKGSYLLYLPRGEGIYERRLPFDVSRETQEAETVELEPDSPPPLPPGVEETIGVDAERYWVFVPAGRYRASGDPQARQNIARPASTPCVPEEGTSGCFLARFETLASGYFAYLNDREWHSMDAAYKRAPRRAPIATHSSVYVRRDSAGVLAFGNPEWTGDWAIFGISQEDATDYCAWLTHRAGATWEFSLPTEDEWEKAARGPDGPSFPWGDVFDTSFCRMCDSRILERKELGPEPCGLFPLDESPYGIRDLAGGVAEWTSTPCGSRGEYRVTKGGDWNATAPSARGASRGARGPTGVGISIGFRVAAHRRP